MGNIDIYATVLHALAPVVEPYGLDRTERGFRRHNDLGDGVVIEVVPVSGGPGALAYDGDVADMALFFVDAALISAPWFEWQTRSDDPTAVLAATVDQGLCERSGGAVVNGVPWNLALGEEAVLPQVQTWVRGRLELYTPFMDRELLLDTLLRKEMIDGLVNPVFSPVVLLAAKGMSPEFVARFALYDEGRERDDWLWDYAIRHTPQGVPVPPRPTPAS